MNQANTFKSQKNAEDIVKGIIKEKQLQMLKEREDMRRTNKFDYFFMICLTTIIGYLGKYGINFLIDYLLHLILGDNYSKKLFMISSLVLYGVSIIFSLIFFYMYKKCIFEHDKEYKKDKIIKISQICGYIIYSEERKPKVAPKRNCCTLCCESIQNCCNETFCYVINSVCEKCLDKPNCSCCCCCKYKEEDYNKKNEVFCYCYKTKRKSLWCNKFFGNKTQRKIFPYMLEYFISQLTTIGFEKHYEKYKNKNVHIKTWLSVFVLSFILFFYYTLSFKRIFFDNNEDENENKDENKDENENKER